MYIYICLKTFTCNYAQLEALSKDKFLKQQTSASMEYVYKIGAV